MDAAIDDKGVTVGDPESVGALAYRLKLVDNALVARKAAAVKALDLTESQCKVLTLLADGIPKSATHLAREALVTSQTMTGIVKNLEAKGLVTRHPSPDHARVMLISLTDTGITKATQAHELARQVESSLRRAMSADDYQRLLELLERAVELVPTLTIET
ncbi:MarR family winged helix-turn-helix transcriptional regulator [Mycolicibacterium goodii]|jgi:DNA-binding MarR family transcriptional regulator|uniref:MarR family winged helix-turn-helix transcriptional regulator n=1 Tax=Mycolicibacterium goodii TaxID=134601 RepID=UPI000C25939E|nr:MarR family winged helix-turn-helix transcriptional regulator [Mycolicibacterium goodii]PJK19194.1 MarR family transcriptional regulator [Mycolicibacterium goodii]